MEIDEVGKHPYPTTASRQLMAHHERPSTSYGFLDEELQRREADAYVHIGNRFDEDLRYLTRYLGSDNPYAFIYTAETARLLTSALSRHQAEREFAGDHVVTSDEQLAISIEDRVVETLDERSVTEVLIPPSTTIIAARALEAAGMEIETTSAVATRRRQKNHEELACIRSVQKSTHAAMAVAEEILATATHEDGLLIGTDGNLTTESLRRSINATLSAHGVSPADNTVIGAGSHCSDLHFRGDVPIGIDDPVLIDLSPRGPEGYHGDFTRTFVAGSPTEWIREAYDAVADVKDIALASLEPGISASTVHDRVVDAFDARGYESGYVDIGFYHSAGHGIGLRLHEDPHLKAETSLRSGDTVTIEPGLYHPEFGGVRLEDLVTVTDTGYENLSDYPHQLKPRQDIATSPEGSYAG